MLADGHEGSEGQSCVVVDVVVSVRCSHMCDNGSTPIMYVQLCIHVCVGKIRGFHARRMWMGMCMCNCMCIVTCAAFVCIAMCIMCECAHMQSPGWLWSMPRMHKRYECATENYVVSYRTETFVCTAVCEIIE